MDFTLNKYESLLKTIKDQNIPVYTIKAWLQNPKESGIIIRHDVDRLAGNALKMAKLEEQYNILTTYYFRITKGSFKPHIIKEIAALGHEIGYHYEDLSLAGGDHDKAIELFDQNLNKIRQLVTVETIAMHGRPLSKYNNQHLWKKHDYKKFNLLGEAFLSIYYADIYYFTDTGRNWHSRKNNIRDFTDTSKQPQQEVQSTNELIDFIQYSHSGKIALIIHPERWNNGFIKWAIYYLFDHMVNLSKKAIRLIYH